VCPGECIFIELDEHDLPPVETPTPLVIHAS
jgi:hypothetical protein